MEPPKTTRSCSPQVVIAALLVALVAAPTFTILKLDSLVRGHQALSCTLLLLCTLAALILTLARQFRANRLRVFETFERGNVPSVGKPELITGNANATYARSTNVFIIDDLHQRLGPTFGLFWGSDPWIQTADLELLQRIFVTEGSVHLERTQLKLPFASEINEALAQASAEKWRHLRRIIGPSFHQRQMRADNVFDDINQVGEQFVRFVERHEGAKPHVYVLDAYPAFKKYTLEVICRVAYGRTNASEWIPGERDELIELIDDAMRLFKSFLARLSTMLPSLRCILGLFVRFTKFGQCAAYIHSAIDESMSIRRRLTAQGKSIGFKDRKMIDTLIECSHSGRMDGQTLKANLFFLLMAGHETSSFTLTFLLFQLAWHPDKQDKLRQAVLVGGQEAEYLDWCIREMLRLFPAVPSGVGRILEHDIEHRGMRLFKGTSVNASIWTIHHTPDYWGADADQFRPERMGEPVDEQARPHLKLRHFGFGHGPRYCIGQSLAMAEMRDVVAKLIVRYQVCPSPNTPRQLRCLSPNLYHWIIKQPVELQFKRLDAT